MNRPAFWGFPAASLHLSLADLSHLTIPRFLGHGWTTRRILQHRPLVRNPPVHQRGAPVPIPQSESLFLVPLVGHLDTQESRGEQCGIERCRDRDPRPPPIVIGQHGASRQPLDYGIGQGHSCKFCCLLKFREIDDATLKVTNINLPLCHIESHAIYVVAHCDKFREFWLSSRVSTQSGMVPPKMFCSCCRIQWLVPSSVRCMFSDSRRMLRMMSAREMLASVLRIFLAASPSSRPALVKSSTESPAALAAWTS